MRRFLFLLWSSLSISLITGGLFSFYFGTILKATLEVRGLWIFDGRWYYASYCFLGAVLTSLGTGMLTAAVLSQRERALRQKAAEFSPLMPPVSNARVLAELNTLKQQISDTQNTSYNYHLSLESRLNQLEARQNGAEPERTLKLNISPVRTEEAQQNSNMRCTGGS